MPASTCGPHQPDLGCIPQPRPSASWDAHCPHSSVCQLRCTLCVHQQTSRLRHLPLAHESYHQQRPPTKTVQAGAFTTHNTHLISIMLPLLSQTEQSRWHFDSKSFSLPFRCICQSTRRRGWWIPSPFPDSDTNDGSSLASAHMMVWKGSGVKQVDVRASRYWWKLLSDFRKIFSRSV